MDPGMRDDMVKDISGSASFFAEQEALLFELVAGYGLSLFPAFVRGTQNAQLILHICLRDDPRIAGDAFDQGEIQGVCQDFMLQTVRLLDDDSYIYTGADLRVCFYISRQKLRTDGNTGSDPQNAFGIPVAQARFHVFKKVGDMYGVLQK